VGVVLGLGLRRNWSFTSLLLGVTAAVAISFTLSTLAVWALTGTGWSEMEATFDRSLDTAVELCRAAGMNEETVKATTEQVQEAFELIPYLSPAVVGISALLFASASLGLVAVLFRRMGQAGVERLSFSQFRVHWALAYGFIGGLGLLLFSRTSSLGGDVLHYTGLNVYAFFQTLFFLQGMALAHWFALSRRLRAGSRLLVFGLALFTQLVLGLVTWAGLLDTWLDYRKRFAPPKQGPPRAAALGGGHGNKEE
jgi:uncharacterized protein YybS (DUF2232 family)